MLIDGTKRNEENTMIGGQRGGLMGGTASSNMLQTGSKGPTQSGGFTNLNKYLQANQGANNQTINKLNTTAQQSAKEAQDAISGAKNVGMTAQQNLDTIKQNQDFVQSSLNDPLKSSNLSRFKSLRDSFNANPTEAISQFDNATAQANATRTQKANELKNYTTSGGLTEYLRSQRTSPRYSQGSQSLDKFLVKGTDEGAQALQNIGKQAETLSQEPGEFGSIRSGLQSQAQSLNPNFLNAEQIRSAANAKAQAERQALQDYQNRSKDVILRDGISNENDIAGTIYLPSIDYVTSRGGQGRDMQNLSRYLGENDTDPIVSRFTPEQVARYTALAEMSGIDPSDVLNQNEQAFAARKAKTNQIAQNFAAIFNSDRQQGIAQEVQAAQAEQARQQQLLVLLAALGMGGGGGGGGLQVPQATQDTANFWATGGGTIG